MADNKFKNAASKLLAQHSVKKEDKPKPAPAALNFGDPLVLDLKPEPRQPVVPLYPELHETRRNDEMTVSNPIVLHHIVMQQSKPVRQETANAEFVDTLIKYLVVMLAALLGWAVAAFTVPDAVLGGAGKIAVGLLAGTAVGIVISSRL